MGLGGGGVTEKNGLKGGGHLKKIRERGGQVKYISNALRWDMFYYS